MYFFYLFLFFLGGQESLGGVGGTSRKERGRKERSNLHVARFFFIFFSFLFLHLFIYYLLFILIFILILILIFILSGVAAWLVINAMRSEKTQFQQLLIQNTSNIWRKNAFSTLLSNSKKEFRIGFGGEEEVREREKERERREKNDSFFFFFFRGIRERKRDKREKKEKKR